MVSKILSICIPTCSRQAALQNALDCLIKEIDELAVKDEAEICVVDNNSTDSTYAMLQHYASRYRFIKIFRNEIDVGCDINFLIALSKGEGEYLWLFGDDDLPEPGSIALIVKKLREETPDIAWLNYSRFCKKDDGSLKIFQKSMLPSTQHESKSFTDRQLFLSLLGDKFTFMGSHVYKRENFLLLMKDWIYTAFIGSFMLQTFLFLYLVCHGTRFLLIYKPLVRQGSQEPLDYTFLQAKLMFGREQILRYFSVKHGICLKNFHRDTIIALARKTLILKAKGQWSMKEVLPYSFIWYSGSLLFWLLLLPVYLLPGFLLKYPYKVFRDLRKA